MNTIIKDYYLIGYHEQLTAIIQACFDDENEPLIEGINSRLSSLENWKEYYKVFQKYHQLRCSELTEVFDSLLSYLQKVHDQNPIPPLWFNTLPTKLRYVAEIFKLSARAVDLAFWEEVEEDNHVD